VVATSFSLSSNCSAILVASQIFVRIFLRRSHCPQQSKFGQVVGEKAGNVILIGRSYVLLGLHDLKIVGYAVEKAVARLLQRALSELPVFLGHLAGAVSGPQISKGVAYFVVHAPLEVCIFRLPAIGLSACILDIRADASAGKDGQ